MWIRSQWQALLLGGLVILPAVAFAASPAVECVAGNCRDGEGTSRSADGHEFSGLWALQDDPFVGRQISTMQRGVYSDARTGRKYEGEFHFIPARIGGFYIFQGARIDDALDEVTRGLFASDKILFPGQQIIFHRARIDFIEQMQDNYSSELEKFKTDQEIGRQRDAARSAAMEAAKNQGGSGLGVLLGVVGGLAQIGGLNLNGLQGNALSGLAGVVTGRQSAGSVLEVVASQLLQQAVGNPSLSKTLGTPKDTAGVVSGLTSLGRAAVPITKADYAASGGSGLGSVLNAVGGALVRQSGAMIAGALGSADLGPGGQLVGALAEKGMNSLAMRVETADPKTGVLGPSVGTIRQPTNLVGNDLSKPGIVASAQKGTSETIMDAVGAAAVRRTGGLISAAANSAEFGVGGALAGSVAQSLTNRLADKVAAGNPRSGPAGADSDLVSSESKATDVTAPLPISVHSPWVPFYSQDFDFPLKRGISASMDIVDAPPGVTLRGGTLYATNDGVYLEGKNAAGLTVAAKYAVRREDPKDPKAPFQDRWLVVEVGRTSGSGKSGPGSFSIGAFHHEDPGEINITWVTYAGYYGYAPALISPYYQRINDANVQRFIPLTIRPDAPQSGRRMAIADGSRVFYEKGGGGSGESFLNRYQPVDVGGNALRADMAVMSEDGLPAYIAGADQHSVYKVSPFGWQRFELNQFGAGLIHTLLFAGHKVWIGYANQILSLDNQDKLELYGKVPEGGNVGGPGFCITGNDIYLASGFYFNGLEPGSRLFPYLQNSPTLKPEDLIKVTAMRAALSTGIYCADDLNGPRLYAAGLSPGSLEMKLFVIRPAYGANPVPPTSPRLQ